MNPVLQQNPARPARGQVRHPDVDAHVAALYRSGADLAQLTELIDSLGFEDRAGEPGLGDGDEIYRIDELVLVRTFTGAGDYTYSIEPYADYVRAWENVREDEAAGETEAEFEACQFRRYGAAVV